MKHSTVYQAGQSSNSKNAVEKAIDISKESKRRTWDEGLRKSRSKIARWSDKPGATGRKPAPIER